MLKTWLPLIIKSLEPILDSRLPAIILLKVEFPYEEISWSNTALPTKEEIEKSCSISVDTDNSTATVIVGEQFDLGLAHSTNISERALIISICRAFAKLANKDLSLEERNKLEAMIVKNDEVRMIHAFKAQKYRNFVQHDLQNEIIEIDNQDVANLRIGLAFRVENRTKGRGSLRSISQCTQFLNKIVTSLEEELCEGLRRFNRSALVEKCLRNHERVSVERSRWMRTARANFALHDNYKNVESIIVSRDMDFNALIFPSRVLIEFALCECPVKGGLIPNNMDLSKLMTKVNAIWQFGGWSDAIYLDAMPHKLTITPLGDIQADTHFESNIVMPFSHQGSQERISGAIDNYDKNFQSPVISETNSSNIEPIFEDAWNQEFGFTLNDLRIFIDAIEDIGLNRKLAVFRIKQNEIYSLISSELCREIVNRILMALVLKPRHSWRTIPEGYLEKDIQLWRFRRQLSSVRRPLFQLDCSANPTLIVVPGLIREAISYIVEGYYEGNFPYRQLRTSQMQQWNGIRANKRGRDFEKQVLEKIKSLDWNTAKLGIGVTELIRRKNDPELGDISRFGDVDVLAWNESANRVLIIECKHLHYHKATGEIAEQLSDYRGQTKKNGKSDDLLKHLKRIELLKARRAEFCKHLGIDEGISIEGWVLFKNPVPMLYAWKEFESKTQIATFDDIEKILNITV